jgi:hypothetical protein
MLSLIIINFIGYTLSLKIMSGLIKFKQCHFLYIFSLWIFIQLSLLLLFMNTTMYFTYGLFITVFLHALSSRSDKKPFVMISYFSTFAFWGIFSSITILTQIISISPNDAD